MVSHTVQPLPGVIVQDFQRVGVVPWLMSVGADWREGREGKTECVRLCPSG